MVSLANHKVNIEELLFSVNSLTSRFLGAFVTSVFIAMVLVLTLGVFGSTFLDAMFHFHISLFLDTRCRFSIIPAVHLTMLIVVTLPSFRLSTVY